MQHLLRCSWLLLLLLVLTHHAHSSEEVLRCVPCQFQFSRRARSVQITTVPLVLLRTAAFELQRVHVTKQLPESSSILIIMT
jgi:hypothetical protein